MNELTDAQKEVLKTLPASFLAQLRTAVTQKRELDEQWAAEEERVERLREMVHEWKTKYDKAFEDALAGVNARLSLSEAGVSQSLAHVDKTKQLQIQTLDEQLTRRKKEIEIVDAQIAERQRKMDDIRAQLAEMQGVMERKRALVDSFNSGTMTPRGASSTVSRRAAMTLFKSDGKTHRVSTVSGGLAPGMSNSSLGMPLSPGSSGASPGGTLSASNPSPLLDGDRNEPTNTPETAEPLSKFDIEMVPARVVLESLQELILEPSGFFVSILSTQVRPNEQEKLGRAWVEIFSANGEFLNMLRATVEREVASTSEIGTLFRSNSMASRMMSAYSRSIGMDYIKSLLKPKIDAIIASKENLEIDTMKIAGDQVEAQRENVVVSSQVIDSNITKLTEHAIDFIQTILAGKTKAPLQFYQICQMLRELVSVKFPTQWKIAIGGYLFLRLMCPCIFLPPDDFGINFESGVSPESKRTLVLVSKILQNLANLQPKFVEEIMAPFSNFVTFNLHSVEQYFDFMAAEAPPAGAQASPLPDYMIRTRLREVLALCASNHAKVSLALQNNAQNNPMATSEFIQLWSFNKAPKLLTLYNKLTQLAHSQPYPEDNGDVLAFIAMIVPPKSTISPAPSSSSLATSSSTNASSSPLSVTSAKIDGSTPAASRASGIITALPLSQLVAAKGASRTDQPYVVLAVLETSTRQDFSAVENAELAGALFPLWEYYERTGDLIQICLDVFVRSPTKSNRPLLDSAAAKLFTIFARRSLSGVVKAALAPGVFALAGKGETLAKREVMMEVAGTFLLQIQLALPELTDQVLQVCKFIANHPRFGIPTVVEFICCLIFIKALEDPEAYSVPTGGGDRGIRKGMLMVADQILLVATGARERNNVAVDSFLTGWNTQITDVVTKWVNSPPSGKKSAVPLMTWPDLSASLDNLRIFLGKNMSSISAILEASTSESRYVKFTMSEVIDQMIKHTAANLK